MVHKDPKEFGDVICECSSLMATPNEDSYPTHMEFLSGADTQ